MLFLHYFLYYCACKFFPTQLTQPTSKQQFLYFRLRSLFFKLKAISLTDRTCSNAYSCCRTPADPKQCTCLNRHTIPWLQWQRCSHLRRNTSDMIFVQLPIAILVSWSSPELPAERALVKSIAHLIGFVILSGAASVSAAEPFEAFLEKHCVRCHGSQKEEGDIDDALFRIETRHAYRKLINLGLTEAFRVFDTRAGLYTFWDYQAGAWQKDNGIRIDHFLLSPTMADRLQSCTINKDPRGWDKPSDHTPIEITIQTAGKLRKTSFSPVLSYKISDSVLY